MRMRWLQNTRAGLCDAYGTHEKTLPKREGLVVWPTRKRRERSNAWLPRGADVLYALNVSGLEAFWALGEVELDSLALIQAPISVLLDS